MQISFKLRVYCEYMVWIRPCVNLSLFRSFRFKSEIDWERLKTIRSKEEEEDDEVTSRKERILSENTSNTTKLLHKYVGIDVHLFRMWPEISFPKSFYVCFRSVILYRLLHHHFLLSLLLCHRHFYSLHWPKFIAHTFIFHPKRCFR